MFDKKIYGKAPITEAVIDIRARLHPDFNLSNLQDMGTVLLNDYPEQNSVFHAQSSFEVGELISSTASQSQVGYEFVSSDKRQMCQCRMDGFTLIRRYPYIGWKAFCGEARRLWEEYCKSIQVTEVYRVAVRYINRLDIPLPIADLKEYIKTAPDIADGIHQGMSGFYMKLEIPQPDIEATLIINETALNPNKPDSIPLILDIDLFRDHDIPADPSLMWDYFEILRSRKNEIFEACITNKTRELIY